MPIPIDLNFEIEFEMTPKEQDIMSNDDSVQRSLIGNGIMIQIDPDLQVESDKENPMNDQIVFPKIGKKIYHSYRKFSTGQFDENSVYWKTAMLRYPTDMKNHDRKIRGVSANKVTFKDSRYFVLVYLLLFGIKLYNPS